MLYGGTWARGAHEWRLVTVRGRIDTVRKLGDRWRAELVVGGERVVVIGQSGAGIPVATVPTGHLATVTGIVRRPYPSATDRRFTILPRGRADVRVDPGGSTGSDSQSSTGSDATKTGTTSGGSPAGGTSAPDVVPSAPDANLADLPTLAGRTVRVGILVGDLFPGGFTLDDGTATGPVTLQGPAADLLPLIAPGDAINVVGRIESTDRGWTVVVADPAGVAAGDPAYKARRPDRTPPARRSRCRRALEARSAGLGSLPGFDAGVAGLGALIAVSAASLAVTLLRGRHLKRLFGAAVATHWPSSAGRCIRWLRLDAGPTGLAGQVGHARPSTIHARRTSA